MAGLPPVFIEFLGKTTGVKTAMKDIKAELATTADESETSFSKFGKVGKAAVAGIGIAAAALAITTVHMAASFQADMTKLSSAAGLTNAQMAKFGYTTDSLNQKVLQIGSSVGVSGNEMAEALYHPISAGLNLQQSLNVVTEAAKEAKISGASLEDTTYSLSSVMKSFNLPANQASQTMADLNAIVGQGDMRFQDLNDSIKNWAPTAAQMGISIKSMGAGLAYLTDRGNNATVASTRLTMGLSMMTTPTKQAGMLLNGLGVSSFAVKSATAGMTNVLQDAGITQSKLAMDLKKPDGLYVALTDIKTGLKKAGIAGTEADSVMAKIFGGGRSDKAIMSLMQNLGGLKTKYEDITKASNTSAFDAAWEKTQKTFSFQMEKMKASLQNLGISIGLKLLPYAQSAIKVLATFGGWLVKHKTIAESLAVVIGGALVVAIGAATVALYGFIMSATVLEALPWIAAITAIIIVIVLLATHWKQVWGLVKSVALDVWHALVTAWDAVASATKTAWHAVTGFVVGAWKDIASFLSSAGAEQITAAKEVWGAIAGAAKDAWNAVASFFVGAWHTVTDPIVSAWGWVLNVTTTVWDAVSGFFKKWWPLLLVIFAPGIALLMAAWNHFHTAVQNTAYRVWNSIRSFFVGVWESLKSDAKAAWSLIQDYVVKPVEWTGAEVASIWDVTAAYLVRVWKDIESRAKEAWNLIKSLVLDACLWVRDQVRTVWDAVVSYLSGRWRVIQSNARTIWNLIKGVIVEPIKSAVDSVTGLAGKLGANLWNTLTKAWNTVKNFGSYFVSIGESIVEGIISGIGKQAGNLFGSLKNLASSALGAAKSFLGINSPSKVFANVVGVAIPEGIAKGVTDNAHLAHSAVGQMAANLSNQEVNIGTTLGTAGGFSAGSGGGGTVQVNLTVQGHVLTDRDLRDLIQQEFLRLGGRNPATWAAFSK